MDELDEMDLDEMDLDDEAAEAEEFDARRRGRKGGARMFSLFRKTVFDYTFLAAGNTSIVIRRALKLSPFYYYWFGLRIHNRNIQLSGSAFNLQFFQTLPHSGDPQEFTLSPASVTLVCNNGDAPPALKLTTSNNLGPYLKVVLQAVQGSGGVVPVQLYAELSAVILARPA